MKKDVWVIRYVSTGEFLNCGKTGTKILWGSLAEAETFPSLQDALVVAKRHWPRTYKAVLAIHPQ